VEEDQPAAEHKPSETNETDSKEEQQEENVIESYCTSLTLL
jgi:hypothetical protein